jgi:hypothetical protein
MSKAPFVVVDWPVPVSVNLSAVATTYNFMASWCPFSQGDVGIMFVVTVALISVLLLPCTMQ